MAVLSRPSLRSTTRRAPGSKTPALDKVQKPGHSSHRSKRPRDSSPGSYSSASSKKLKSSPEALGFTTARPQSDLTTTTLPIRSSQRPIASKNVVTQAIRTRKPDPVLVPSKHVLQAEPDSDGELHIGINQNLPPITNNVDKRSLRSHDGGSRSKSELAPYFSNYDELISIQPKLSDVLTSRTVLHISDEPTKAEAATTPTFAPPTPSRGRPSSKIYDPVSAITSFASWPAKTFTTLTNAVRVDLTTLSQQRGRKPSKDPLSDAVYLRIHAKEERKEKQLRNIEKERAMHEKSQLERLLEGLRGHDWLRVMGISGITESEKKLYEPKRDYLIHEVRNLLEKFRLWKEEEKRRKVEKDDEDEAEDGDEDDEDDEDDDGEEDSDEDDGESSGHDVNGYDEAAMNEDMNMIQSDSGEDNVADSEDDGVDSTDADDDDAHSYSDPPDYRDVDASAARQLHMEAIFATQAHGRRQKLSQLLQPSEEQDSHVPCYEKSYMRVAAEGKKRRSGRSIPAFRKPVPFHDAKRSAELPTGPRAPSVGLEGGRQTRRHRRMSKED